MPIIAHLHILSSFFHSPTRTHLIRNIFGNTIISLLPPISVINIDNFDSRGVATLDLITRVFYVRSKGLLYIVFRGIFYALTVYAVYVAIIEY